MGLNDVKFYIEAKSLAVSGEAGNELFFDYTGLLKLLDACEKYGVIVLGIEGFNILGNQIEPNIDALADLSSLSHPKHDLLVKRSVAESKKFLASVDYPEELLWSITTSAKSKGDD